MVRYLHNILISIAFLIFCTLSFLKTCPASDTLSGTLKEEASGAPTSLYLNPSDLEKILREMTLWREETTNTNREKEDEDEDERKREWEAFCSASMACIKKQKPDDAEQAEEDNHREEKLFLDLCLPYSE